VLKWYDSLQTYQGIISKYRDLRIESELKTADKTLSVTLLEDIGITNECYIRTETDEYVVKEVTDITGNFKQIVAALNLEELEAKAFKTFSVTSQTIESAARTAITGTGWRVAYSDVTKVRNAGMLKKSALGILQGLCTAFMCDMVFDTINKTVSFYNELGSNKGVYFRDGINLKKLTAKASSYDFYTRIIPYGADDLDIKEVNGGVEYVENYQYSTKVRTYIWIDTNYTDATALKEDATAKLADMSRPTVSYSAEIRDLAKMSDVYSLFEYGLGDTITLTDGSTKTRDTQRIVKLVEYPDNPEKNTAELSNTFLTWEELQERERAASEIVNAVISQDGTFNGIVKVSDILHWNEEVEAGIQGSAYLGNYIEATDGRISAVELTVGTIAANYITAEEVAATYATIADLEADYATIASLDAAKADIQGLNAKVASIETAYISTAEVNSLLANYTKTKDLQAQYATINLANVEAGSITTAMIGAGVVGTEQIADASITSAKIVALDAAKITTGTLDASLLNVVNLNAASITVGMINGQQIDSGTIKLTNLAQEVTDEIDAATAFRLDTEYTTQEKTYEFTAHLFYGANDVTADYDARKFRWFVRNEDGDIDLGRGYTMTVSRDLAGYVGTIVCRWSDTEEAVIIGSGNQIIVGSNGETLIGIF